MVERRCYDQAGGSDHRRRSTFANGIRSGRIGASLLTREFAIMRIVPFVLLPLLLSAPLSGAAAAELKVTLEDVATGSGHLLVAVCTAETFLRRGCPYTGRAPAVSGEAEVVVRGIEPGVYAVQAFHDENDNLDLDRNFLGWPEEGLGFSNDAPMRFGPPRFADAAIAIGADGAATRLRLRYFR
jgi:uncharacterized protein (DUF2141 family)